ncbi:hypothetical protein LCGC14_0592790 [marine sediment metagenome]|uniref:Uncharacterized protein n=1 Tax=marine sediment metagenome TaxID=412755 RepID=A0A0F9TZ31_9ZZZZ
MLEFFFLCMIGGLTLVVWGLLIYLWGLILGWWSEYHEGG